MRKKSLLNIFDENQSIDIGSSQKDAEYEAIRQKQEAEAKARREAEMKAWEEEQARVAAEIAAYRAKAEKKAKAKIKQIKTNDLPKQTIYTAPEQKENKVYFTVNGKPMNGKTVKMVNGTVYINCDDADIDNEVKQSIKEATKDLKTEMSDLATELKEALDL